MPARTHQRNHQTALVTFGTRLAKTAAVVAMAALAASPAGAAPAAASSAEAAPKAASARLEPTRGQRAAGELRFMPKDGGVWVEGSVSGLTPSAEHGFHIHEKGDCSSGDGNSAGGHFNPTGQPHGALGAPHHVGDMPALKSDASGQARIALLLPGVALNGAGGIIGRAVIVHADPDDYRTQPTGNAGARIACGVIVPR